MNQSAYYDPIPTYLNKKTVEKISSTVAEQLGFEIGDPIETIVSALGGKIQYGWNSTDEINGGSIIARNVNDFVIFVSELTSPKRDRFTIAHELGHLFLHLRKVKEKQPDAVMRATRHVDMSNTDQQRAEWEANWFAAQLLMPREAFKSCVQQFDVEYAAQVFNVSLRAAEIRQASI